MTAPRRATSTATPGRLSAGAHEGFLHPQAVVADRSDPVGNARRVEQTTGVHVLVLTEAVVTRTPGALGHSAATGSPFTFARPGALRNAELEGPFGIGITGQIGRGSRTVHLTLTYDPQEIDQEPSVLVTQAVDALHTAGIHIQPSQERTSITDALWDGEPVPLHRT